MFLSLPAIEQAVAVGVAVGLAHCASSTSHSSTVRPPLASASSVQSPVRRMYSSTDAV